MTPTPAYPTRPPFFAYRFCRLLAKACLASEIGPEGCWMLTVIVQTEDAKGYRGPVTCFNEPLCPLVGSGSTDGLARVRIKAIRAGWLTYIPGGKGRAGRYWVNVPEGLIGVDDAPTDETMAKYLASNLRENAETTAGQPRGMCGTNRGECAEHSSLTLTQEEERKRARPGSPAGPTLDSPSAALAVQPEPTPPPAAKAAAKPRSAALAPESVPIPPALDGPAFRAA